MVKTEIEKMLYNFYYGLREGFVQEPAIKWKDLPNHLDQGALLLITTLMDKYVQTLWEEIKEDTDGALASVGLVPPDFEGFKAEMINLWDKGIICFWGNEEGLGLEVWAGKEWKKL